jgi:hypothetical protein
MPIPKKKSSGKIYANCIDCPHHEVINDPDPSDWFCDDDVAVACNLVKTKPDNSTNYAADRFPRKKLQSLVGLIIFEMNPKDQNGVLWQRNWQFNLLNKNDHNQIS